MSRAGDEEPDSEADSIPDDPAETPFPACPRCEKPIVTVTTTGPGTHHASCGCQLTLGELNRL